MYFHWREPQKKRRRGVEKKRGTRRNTEAKLCPGGAPGPGQSGRLMLLYIGCHSASPPPSAIGRPSPYQFLAASPEKLFAQVDSDTVLNEPQAAPPPTPHPRLALSAVDCVIESESSAQGPAESCESKPQPRLTPGGRGAGSQGEGGSEGWGK